MEEMENKLMKTLIENKELKEKLSELQKENHQLKQLLTKNPKKTNPLPNKNNTVSEELNRRMNIFRGLFKGRNDVFAYRWQTEKAGYSPARKANTKDFYPLTDNIIYDHLSGKRTIGLYPLMKDNTCSLLAVDFDKKDWKDDVRAFIKTCKKFGVPASAEISRSGNGCHVWIFFSEPIPAVLARKLGDLLLTHSLQNRPNQKLNSYDRMFPNQDILTKEKLGNLIALPLQGESRKNNTTVFVDENFNMYEEQWHYLSKVKKMSKHDIRLIIETTDKEPLIIKENTINRSEAMPKKINILYKNGIYISKVEVPTHFLLEIAKLAKISNPAYYRAQKGRMSTKGIPKSIDCSEDEIDYLKIPRGCLADLINLLKQESIDYEITDKSFPGREVQTNFQAELSIQQEDALQKITKSPTGILAAATGFGKTVVAASLIASRNVNTLVIVHRKQLMDQWREQLSTFLDIDPQLIGQIGGGINSPTGIIDLVTIQSLNYKNKSQNLNKYGQIIVDECHHFAAFTFEKILKEFDATYVHGLTATPKRKDGLEAIMKMQLGPIRYKLSAKEQAKIRPFKHVLIPRYTAFKSKDESKNKNIQKMYGELAVDANRNNMIFNDVLKELERGSAPIVITERIEHVEKLAEKFQGFTKNLIVLTGKLSKKEKQNRLKALRELPDDQERLVISTGKYIGEGFDNKRLDTLFLANPISWDGTLKQYVGRLHRLHEQKTVVKVYDYVDKNEVALEKMYRNREKGYKALGYITEIPGIDEAVAEQMRLF